MASERVPPDAAVDIEAVCDLVSRETDCGVASWRHLDRLKVQNSHLAASRWIGWVARSPQHRDNTIEDLDFYAQATTDYAHGAHLVLRQMEQMLGKQVLNAAVTPLQLHRQASWHAGSLSQRPKIWTNEMEKLSRVAFASLREMTGGFPGTAQTAWLDTSVAPDVMPYQFYRGSADTLLLATELVHDAALESFRKDMSDHGFMKEDVADYQVIIAEHERKQV